MTTLTSEETTVTRQQLIDGLNQDLAGEYQAIIMYIHYAAMTTGLDRLQLAQFLSSQVPDETAHARFLAQKIPAFGGVPTTQPRAVPAAATDREIVENVLDTERRTIAAYTERVQRAERSRSTRRAGNCWRAGSASASPAQLLSLPMDTSTLLRRTLTA